MPKFSHHSLVAKLLHDGYIDAERDPEMYEALKEDLPPINDILFYHCRYVRVDNVLGVAAAINIPDQEMEAYFEEEGYYPIAAPSTRATLDMFESALAAVFRNDFSDAGLDAKARWRNADEVFNDMLTMLPPNMQYDRENSDERLRRMLKKLKTFGLIEIDDRGSETLYRAEKQIVLKITSDDVERHRRRVYDHAVAIAEREKSEKEAEQLSTAKLVDPSQSELF